ncbi:MAG: hypothetical protein JHC82_00280 [Stenotrophomonas sp.]|nr:hypothetical protein [Stenotrophomonas sp.]
MLWTRAWGVLDLVAVVLLMVASVVRGRIPLWDDVADALTTSQQYGSSLPLVVTCIHAVVVLSLLATGYLLSCNLPAGRHLAAALAPFRIALVIPSVPFLGYLGSTTGSVQVIVAALVLTELGKLWTLRKRAVVQVEVSRVTLAVTR